jgi:colanic acid biosynthesis glycosyl transferase WcaI
VRIVFWSPNYAPEPIGLAPLVTDAAEWLASGGHDVEVVTAMPNYPERRIAAAYRGIVSCRERHGPVQVRRSWLRVHPGEQFLDKALYELSFAGFSAPGAVKAVRSADVLVCTVPSLAATVAAAALRRLRRYPRLVLWLQDLVLLAARALGDVPPILARARKLEAAAFRSADRIIACSPGFRDYLREVGVPEKRVTYLHNWTDVGWITPTPPTADSGPTRFLYAGNLGYTQGFETLIEAARMIDGQAEIEIVGGGNAAAHVSALAQSAANVNVRPPVPRHDFPALLASADAHLVLQRRVGGGANFPSKIASYLASGRPIIASINLDSPAAATLRESGAALLVPPEEPSSLVEAMMRLHSEPEFRTQLGRAAREFSLRVFDRGPALAKLEAALLE